MKASLKEQIYTDVIEDIIRGRYPPNTILTEKALIDRFGVSKSPVRDALIELCNENVLRSIPRVGYEVIQLTEKTMREIMEFRYLLESQCLRRITQIVTPWDTDRLDSFLAESEAWAQKKQEIVDHWKNNMEFHLLLLSFAKNEYIYDTLKKAMTTQMRGYAQFHWDLWHQTRITLDMTTHKKIVGAVKQKDADQAIHFLEEDLGLLAASGAAAQNW